MTIAALPEALELWTDPRELIATWEAQPDKAKQELAVRDFVGRAGNVADLGCGAGRFSATLDYTSYWGFDFSVAMIDWAKQAYPNGPKFSVADIFNFEPGVNFDTLVMIDVAIHQNKPVEAIERVLALWKARRYFFTILAGEQSQRLLNTVVVSVDELGRLTAKAKRGHIQAVRGETFFWHLLEFHK